MFNFSDYPLPLFLFSSVKICLLNLSVLELGHVPWSACESQWAACRLSFLSTFWALRLILVPVLKARTFPHWAILSVQFLHLKVLFKINKQVIFLLTLADFYLCHFFACNCNFLREFNILKLDLHVLLVQIPYFLLLFYLCAVTYLEIFEEDLCGRLCVACTTFLLSPYFRTWDCFWGVVPGSLPWGHERVEDYLLLALFPPLPQVLFSLSWVSGHNLSLLMWKWCNSRDLLVLEIVLVSFLCKASFLSHPRIKGWDAFFLSKDIIPSSPLPLLHSVLFISLKVLRGWKGR